MNKLDPYVGVSYRGESRSEPDFRAFAAVGSTHRQHSLVSTSKNEGTAFGFATKNLGPGREIAVFWVYEHTGAKGVGADLEMLSALTGEGEVLLFPDAPSRSARSSRSPPAFPRPAARWPHATPTSSRGSRGRR